ncbi:MAG: AzlC family ABC transporter permease [Pseudomonadota bacterium]
MIANKSFITTALASPQTEAAEKVSTRNAFIAGLRACGALAMAAVPFGMVCGAAAKAAGFDFHQAFALSWLVFAGSSQIVASQLFASGAPAWVIVVTGIVVNLRFMMYSAALAPHMKGLTRRRRWLAAYLLTDQAFAVTLARAAEGRPRTESFYFGLSAGLWLFWQLASLAGIVLGALIPPSWSMDFVVALTFIAVLAPVLKDRDLAVAATCGAVAAVALDLPLKLNLIAAAIIGIAAGMLTSRLWKR